MLLILEEKLELDVLTSEKFEVLLKIFSFLMSKEQFGGPVNSLTAPNPFPSMQAKTKKPKSLSKFNVSEANSLQGNLQSMLKLTAKW